eukprot:Lithocolla_globosa_v1_NODE_41_length_8221_cov_7.943914.p6 type:complete len:112 gc:universal NODE_41_length_8221_cov_7.943914:3969-4304(+)
MSAKIRVAPTSKGLLLLIDPPRLFTTFPTNRLQVVRRSLCTTVNIFGTDGSVVLHSCICQTSHTNTIGFFDLCCCYVCRHIFFFGLFFGLAAFFVLFSAKIDRDLPTTTLF